MQSWRLQRSSLPCPCQLYHCYWPRQKSCPPFSAGTPRPDRWSKVHTQLFWTSSLFLRFSWAEWDLGNLSVCKCTGRAAWDSLFVPTNPSPHSHFHGSESKSVSRCNSSLSGALPAHHSTAPRCKGRSGLSSTTPSWGFSARCLCGTSNLLGKEERREVKSLHSTCCEQTGRKPALPRAVY